MQRHSPITKKRIGVRGENNVFTIDLPANSKRVTRIIITTKLTGDQMPVNRHFYGTSVVPGAYDDAFVNSLSNEQMESTVRVFSMTAGAGEKIYYARPSRLDGIPSFEINGASAGFGSPIAVNVVDPDTGYTEEYYLFESNDSDLGASKLYVY